MIKKILISLAMFSYAMSLTFNCTNKRNEIHSRNLKEVITNKAELGKGVNLATDSYCYPNNNKQNKDIFDSSWLETRIENGSSLNLNRGRSFSYDGRTIDELYYNRNKALKGKFGYDLDDKEFTSWTNQIIHNDLDERLNACLSRYYYCMMYEFGAYSKFLPNAADYDLYRDHLDEEYINNVSKLLDGQLSYTKFFDLYGTHIVTALEYGTSFSLIYSAASNTFDFDQNTTSTINKLIKAKFARGENTYPDSLNVVDYGIDRNKFPYIDDIFIESVGGDKNYSFNDKESFEKNIFSWLDTFKGNEKVIFYNSYYPIWKMLPNEFNNENNRSKIERYYHSYLNNKFNESNNPSVELSNYVVDINLVDEPIKVQGSFQKKGINFSSGLIASVDLYNSETLVKNKRNHIYQITDLELIRLHEFQKVLFKLTFDVSEIDDGNRTIGIFTKEKYVKESDALTSSLIKGKKGKEKGYVTYTVDFDNKEFNLSELEEILYIRFGSTGNAFNAYKLRNVNLKITFSK